MSAEAKSASESGQIRNISDTALWVAVYRAREAERPDAAFRDPYARLLAGERGRQMAAAQPFSDQNEWSFLARTWVFDRFIEREVEAGADTVINLAAGLDTRPYRMALPRELRWVEVDLPALLAYKEEKLSGAQPACRLERVALDLAERDKRCELFARLGGESRRALIVTEGLLIYLTREENERFAQDLAAQASFERWVLDSASPGLLKMLQQNIGAQLESSPLKFAPEEGLAFFERFGWRRLVVRSMPEGAAEINRLPEFMKPYLNMPVPDPPGEVPWGGVALFGRSHDGT